MLQRIEDYYDAVPRPAAGAQPYGPLTLFVERGCGVVFLAAQDEDVARVYERIGFRRIGTAGLAEPA